MSETQGRFVGAVFKVIFSEVQRSGDQVRKVFDDARMSTEDNAKVDFQPT